MTTRATWLAEGYARRIRLRTADHERAAAEYRSALAVFAGAWQLYIRMLSPAEIEDYHHDVAARIEHIVHRKVWKYV